jgi:iron complex transport system ATP-binding protein
MSGSLAAVHDQGPDQRVASLLVVDALTKSFGGVAALRDVAFGVAPGEVVALIGPNGAGKTTVLRALTGLVRYDGAARVRGRDVAAAAPRALAREVALVPQVPVVPPALTVVEYVLLGRTPHLPYLGRESAADLTAVARALRRLDLDALASRALSTLSGGERQRAVLARALAQEAPLLLLDEPTTALDIGRQQSVLELVDCLRRELGLTVVAAMHDLTLAAQYADRLVLLSRGFVAADGPPADVLTEWALAEHYQARVDVLPGPAPVVVPRRAAFAAEAQWPR